MISTLATTLIWAAALGSGLMAGVYFAFSGFIMRALGEIEPERGIAAMNAINRVILRSWFMPLFFGSTLIALILVILALMNWGEAGSGWLLLAGEVYLLGMFGCTAAFNVPLNNRLAGLQQASAEAEAIWADYLTRWTRWNHLRTLSCLASCAISIGLLWVL